MTNPEVISIATGGDPAGALVAALAHSSEASAASMVLVAHDDECPCAGNTRPIETCTCEIVEVHIRRLPL